MAWHLLTETGDALLQENGSFINLEDFIKATSTVTVGAPAASATTITSAAISTTTTSDG